ncbi:putative DNA binding domain-containing protein [Cuneatibacter sp. NSJ-177]|uniref:RNA-binding domain-containing protein n=1 Tax=Cuneatibacter sp. NSJ-177 TaxID=2931401 RepID=UPI001FD53D5D|nr:RNA-binding domain-containing protein [Cuneatibacter sp. NSJ-177]MCJ7835756.1 putative DNA binding domain-containing protein [Cuneatibacter sp. NSJ-177]
MIFQESETVELKAIVVEDIKKEIVAFANCEGGKLYIGVQDDGTVSGLDNPDETSLQISNMVRDAIKPDLTMFLHYETLTVAGKKIVAVDIHQGTERPYYIAKKGLRPEGVYVRQGYSSVPATNTAIRRMIKETDGDRFEEMRSLEQNLTFESAKKIFAQRHVTFGPVQMKTLGLVTQDGVYTNLGLLLSDQCVHTIKAAVFQGTKQNEFKDRKEFTGSLFQQMDEVYDYIDFRNQTHSTFEKLYRIDRRDYPETAVREALLNLLVHREYSFRASSFISLYTDRLEFTSIGGLVSGVTLKDVTMGISVCRNVKLANIFYRLELIEAYGTGLIKIMDAYEGTGMTPQIETSDNAFKIILPNLNVISESVKQAQTGSEKDTSEKKVIALTKERGFITRKEVEMLLDMGQSSCGRLLRKMTENGLLIQDGKGKNTRYSLPR